MFIYITVIAWLLRSLHEHYDRSWWYLKNSASRQTFTVTLMIPAVIKDVS